MTDVVLSEQLERVRWITINRPERRNALNQETVLPAEAFTDQVQAYAAGLSKTASLAMAAIKASVHDALGNGPGDELTHEMQEQRALLRTDDVREEIAAFLETRNPVSQGR